MPDQILGLDISEACQIHDYLYHIGENEADRRYADDVFKTNMWILCDEAGGWKTWFRKVLCWYYWLGVRKFGQDAFWRDKWLD